MRSSLIFLCSILCDAVFSEDSFDAREQWPGCIGPVLNQDTCGSCYAFSSTGVLSDRLCISGVKKQTFSPQSVVSCDVPWQSAHSKDGGNGGCEGAAPYEVFQYLEKYPITTCTGDHCHKGCMPYVSGYTKDGSFCDDTMTQAQCQAKYNCKESNKACNIPTCPYASNFPAAYANDAKCADGSSWTTSVFAESGSAHCVTPGAGAEAAIKAEIKKNGPMTTNIVVCFSDSFWHDGTFVYNETNNPHFNGCGGHAVTITGWGSDGGIPYWHIRNSWSDAWGSDGYFRMKRGSNFMQVEEAVCGATPTTTAPTDASGQTFSPLPWNSSFVPGTWFEDDVAAEHVHRAARVYLSGRHEPYAIRSAESQVVNGLNHRIVLHVGTVGGNHGGMSTEHRFTVHHSVDDAFAVIAKEEPKVLTLESEAVAVLY